MIVFNFYTWSSKLSTYKLICFYFLRRYICIYIYINRYYYPYDSHLNVNNLKNIPLLIPYPPNLFLSDELFPLK